MDKPLDLSIIILSYNTQTLLVNCIKSILDNHPSRFSYEIIVVDNASKDSSPDVIKNMFPQIKLLINKDNLGFAEGNNIGLKTALGKYCLLLNSDTLVKPQTFDKMIEFMNNHPDVGISSCRLLNRDGSIQATGGGFPDLLRIFMWMFFLDDIPGIASIVKSYHPHSYTYNANKELDWVTGAFFLIKAELLRKVGYLDNEYFMYVEDVDYCYRAKKAGYKIIYYSKSEIIHLGRGSSLKPGSSTLREFQNLKLFYKKHYPISAMIILHCLLKAGALLRWLIFGIIIGSKEARTTYAKTFISA